jgi:hypothetical protein
VFRGKSFLTPGFYFAASFVTAANPVKLNLNPQLRKTFFHSLNPASQQRLGRFPDLQGGKNEK